MFTAYCHKNFQPLRWAVDYWGIVRSSGLWFVRTSLPALLLVVPAKQRRKVFPNSVVVGPQILSQGVDLVQEHRRGRRVFCLNSLLGQRLNAVPLSIDTGATTFTGNSHCKQFQAKCCDCFDTVQYVGRPYRLRKYTRVWESWFLTDKQIAGYFSA